MIKTILELKYGNGYTEIIKLDGKIYNRGDIIAMIPFDVKSWKILNLEEVEETIVEEEEWD